MFQSWLIQTGIIFVVRQAAQFGLSLDWSRMKHDWQQRVRKVVPGEIADDFFAGLAGSVLDAAHNVLHGGEKLGDLVKLAQDGKYTEACELLKQLISQAPYPADYVDAFEEACGPSGCNADVTVETAAVEAEAPAAEEPSEDVA